MVVCWEPLYWSSWWIDMSVCWETASLLEQCSVDIEQACGFYFIIEAAFTRKLRSFW